MCKAHERTLTSSHRNNMNHHSLIYIQSLQQRVFTSAAGLHQYPLIEIKLRVHKSNSLPSISLQIAELQMPIPPRTILSKDFNIYLIILRCNIKPIILHCNILHNPKDRKKREKSCRHGHSSQLLRRRKKKIEELITVLYIISARLWSNIHLFASALHTKPHN